MISHLTGVEARRWWPENHDFHESAALAAKKAITRSNMSVDEVGMLIYAGVYKDSMEPATAAKIGHRLGLNKNAVVFDLSNACLGALNAMATVANAIELGQIEAGIIVAAESAREITELTIQQLNTDTSSVNFWSCFAVFTGGSGAAAIVLARSDPKQNLPRICGVTSGAALAHNELSHWGFQLAPDHKFTQSLTVDSVNTLHYGLELGAETWPSFLKNMNWATIDVDHVITHQIGREHQSRMIKHFGISSSKVFETYRELGNIGAVSLPLTIALAEREDFFTQTSNVALLGIGSGLNCLMMGVKWSQPS